jgi:hypothetical protein
VAGAIRLQGHERGIAAIAATLLLACGVLAMERIAGATAPTMARCDKLRRLT